MSNDATGNSADSSVVTNRLDPRSKLHGLSREEDCMLKSALAYVVVRARQKKRVKGGRSNSPSPFDYILSNDKERGGGGGGGKRHHREPMYITDYSNGPLDRLFYSGGVTAADAGSGLCKTPTTSFGPGRGRLGRGGNAASSLNSPSIISLTSSLLWRKGPESTVHLDRMFTTACSLAKAVMVRRQQASPGGVVARNDGDDGFAALIGATTHLAQQLKTLLLIEQEEEMKKNRVGQQEGRGSRIPQTPSVVVFPATVTGTKKRQRQRSTSPPPNSQSTTPSKSSRTAVTIQTTPTINNANNKDDKTVDHTTTTPTKTDDRHTTTVVTASSWIFSSLKASSDITDIRSSFFVYQTMIPYVGMNHPTLIGHIFVIASNMIRDLIDDKMSIRGSSTTTAAGAGIANGDHYKSPLPDNTRMKIMSLNVLAVESLRLLESCWLADVPRDVEKEHRDFLLLTLQDKLGDLLVPLPLSDIAYAYSRCSQQTATVVRHKRHQHRLQQQAAATAAAVAIEQERKSSLNATNKIGTERTSPTQKSYSDQKTTKNLTPSLLSTGSSSKRPRKFQSPAPKSGSPISNINSSQYLDPGTKLIMRLSVYMLLSV